MKKVMALALAMVLLVASAHAAQKPDTRGMRPREAYLAGMEAYEQREYAAAAVYFEAAGNHVDALKWAFYCQAISLILDGRGSEKEIVSAKVRFELLAAQSFEQANQWVAYCDGRQWEDTVPTKALGYYGTILVHDSLERYLACKNKSQLIENEETLRARVDKADRNMRGDPAYQAAMEFYEGKDYAQASSYFFLAGNNNDAPLWRFFCQAIQLVEQDEVEDAAIIFDLLVLQGFEEADMWSRYCEGRKWENSVPTKAIEIYKSIFVYDSAERYLRLKNVD